MADDKITFWGRFGAAILSLVPTAGILSSAPSQSPPQRSAAISQTIDRTSRRAILSELIHADSNTACISTRTLQSPWENAGHQPQKALTVEQDILARLVRKMDGTPIGQALNASARENDVLWCMERNDQDYRGVYKANLKVAFINAANMLDAEFISRNNIAFNKALDSAYEENMHAYQHAHGLLDAPENAGVGDHIAWHMATETTARVTAYSALIQHKQRGDGEPARYAQIDHLGISDDIEGTAGQPDRQNLTLRSVFDSLYDQGKYQEFYQQEARSPYKGMNQQDWRLPAEAFSALGYIPGLGINFLPKGFDPSQPRYNLIKPHAP